MMSPTEAVRGCCSEPNPFLMPLMLLKRKIRALFSSIQLESSLIRLYAEDLAQEEELIFICGHYEGYDERIKTLVTDEISLGDYVLTGGELAAMTMIDATVRLIPEVIGKESSHQDDSFSSGLLEYPQYTRPYNYRGMVVPDVLMSGHHEKIRQWRLYESLKKTYERRPDLLEHYQLTAEEEKNAGRN